MANYNSHPNYNTSKDPAKNGALFGYLGKEDDSWTEDELQKLGVELIEWFFKKRDNIWMQEFFTEEKGILSENVVYLEKKYPKSFGRFVKRGKEIQESRLASMPLAKKIDGNQARFILENKHGWQGKHTADTSSEEEKSALRQLLKATRQFQDSSALNKEDNNNNNESKS